MDYKIIRISDEPSLISPTAECFHEKWRIPKSAYIQSMTDAMAKNPHTLSGILPL